MSTITFNVNFSVKDILRVPRIRKALRDREDAHLKNIAWLDEDLAEKRHLKNIAWLDEDLAEKRHLENIAWLDEDLAEKKRHLENIAWLDEDLALASPSSWNKKNILKITDVVSRGGTKFKVEPRGPERGGWINVMSNDKSRRFVIETPRSPKHLNYGILTTLPTKTALVFTENQLNWSQEFIRKTGQPQMCGRGPTARHRYKYHLDERRMCEDLKKHLKLLHD